MTKKKMRSYDYALDDLHRLFWEIIESLSSPEEPGDVILRILTKICEHFRFGCGFIYEADHSGVFILKEEYAGYRNTHLPQSLRMESQFGTGDMDELLCHSYLYRNFEEADENAFHPRIFSANSLIIVPALDEDKKIIGFVGLLDRRRHILLNNEAVQAAKMVLNLLANYIKLRIYQHRLEMTRQSLVSILDNTGVDIYVNDFQTHEILYINKSMAAPYGGWENNIGKKCYEAFYTNKDSLCIFCPKKMLIDENGNPSKIYSWDYQRPFDGSWFRVLSAVFRWIDGRLAHVVSSVDITKNKQNEAIIAHMANFDDLTKLPNRRKLMVDLNEAVDSAKENNSGVYLLFFDLDNFKGLNDSMGHKAGDQLLSEVGKALQSHPLTQNHAYRYGGDEFVLLYRNVQRQYMENVVASLLERFQQPWRLDGVSPICSSSIGIAEFPSQGDNSDELLRNADKMMYKAKQSGRGMACFYDGQVIAPV